MNRHFKKMLICALSVLMLVCSLSFMNAAAAEVTMEEVYEIICEGNKDFAGFAAQDAFDIDYFKIPGQSEELRSGYEAKALELTDGMTDDLEKAKAIYDWICYNIYYDYDYYNNPGTYSTFWSASGVYENRRGVCEGYAILFVEMCRCAGVPARKIDGYAVTESLTAQELLDIYNNKSTNHSWSEFYYDGQWYFVDSTWGSGNTYENGTFTDGRKTDSYFCTDLNMYSYTHIPVRYESKFLCNDFVLTVSKSSVSIDEYIGDGGVVEVPAGIGITKVCSFGGNTAITEIIIPEGVTSTGSFENCTALESVTLPDTLTSLGSFKGCTALKSVVIPDGVKSISSNFFDGCTSLETVHLGDGLTSFNSYVFKDCNSLETITGGKNLTYLSGHAFYNCPKLKDAACFQELSYVDSRAFYKCPSITTVILTKRTEALYDYSFYGMTSLKTVIIPSDNTNITSIGYAAFYQCTSLETLAIPSTVTSIGEYAFNGASNLKTILFEGTQEQWDAITVGNYNSVLNKVTVVCLGDHEHTYTASEIKKATCISEGEVEYKCQCTDEYAHTYTKLTPVSVHCYGSVTTDATCTADGKTVYTCENCGDSYSEIISSKGHKYSAEYTVDKEATCTEEGSKSKHCENCEAVTEVTVIAKTDHSYTEKVSETAATCVNGGTIIMKCLCGKTQTVNTEPNKDNHTGKTQTKNNTEASCGTKGYTGDTCCSDCGAVLKKGEEIPATENHSYTSDITVKPTCTAEGTRTFTCLVCSEDYNEPIATVDHIDVSGDSRCDYGCGFEFTGTSEPEPEPEKPDEPADESCNHLCHKGGFMGFIWKIVRFFTKLFKINPICDCGAAHY